MRWKVFIILIGFFLFSNVLAISDTSVFQGQYYIENEFQQGTYNFTFDIYTGEIFGDKIFSHSQTLTTGNWGEWKVEIDGISEYCNDTTKDYFVEIIINENIQTPRKRLTHFTYLRKDIDETTTGDLTISSILKFFSGGYIQELTTNFLINKGLEVQGDLNVTGSIYSANKLVCLEDGTNCQTQSFTDTNCTADGSCPLITYDSELNYTIDTDTSAYTECATDEVLLGNGSCISSSGFGGADTSAYTECTGSELLLGNGSCMGFPPRYVSFISTVDGDLKTGPKYLPLGTDSPISNSDDEASWIIDRDLTITGFFWNAQSNNMNKVAEIILIKSTSNKNSFSETSLSEDIQGATTGSATGGVSFLQGDLVAIKYSSVGSGGKKIKDLSIALIGEYN